MITTTLSSAAPAAASGSALHRAVWRWRFYAGLIVAPFLTVPALSGLVMLYGSSIETFLGEAYAAVPGGTLKLVVSPAAPDRATVALVTAGDQEHAVSVDPDGARVVGRIVKGDTWFYWANRIHGKLTIGDVGDRMMEVSAGLGIMLILSGLHVWWPRKGRSFVAAVSVDFALRGRPDSMDGDTTDPTGDRTVHIDRCTGRVLADVRFADHPVGGKAMAIGVALHQGNVGRWNTLLNPVFCLAVPFTTASGVVVWWKRRPAGALAAPREAQPFRPTVPVAAVAAAVCLAFPLTGLATVLFGVIDPLLPRRIEQGVA